MKVLGNEKVKSIFGRWPIFHDAEIMSFTFERDNKNKTGRVILKLNYWENDTEYSDDIHYEYVKKNNSIITLIFSGLFDSEVDGFNYQNVINELRFKEIKDGVLVEIDSIFGIGGKLKCKNVEVYNVENVGKK